MDMHVTSTGTVSPLMLADRLIGLAKEADQAGLGATAARLVRLAVKVCSEKPQAGA